MSSMFSLGNISLPRSLPFGIFSSSKAAEQPIKLESVEIVDLEDGSEPAKRRLKHLIKANHAQHSILYHNLQYHNHMTHLLGSAYLFGASPEHLTELYDEEAKSLEPWTASPGEVTKHDWRDFLGKKEYQRAFVDFYEDQLVQHGYVWKNLVEEYLCSGEEPLIHNMISGLAHPLIHLGYAYELSSHTIAIEALANVSTCYNDMHIYLDRPEYTRPPSSVKPASTPLELLMVIQEDKRFDGMFDHAGSANLEKLFAEKESLVLDYWNAWEPASPTSDPTQQFALSQMSAVAVLVGTVDSGDSSSHYDFFLVHLLTSSHAARIVLPLVPPKFQIALVRQWWLVTIGVYIAQLRPAIELNRINHVDLKGRDWSFVEERALNGPSSLDAHYIKGLRAMREAANTWGDAENFYLRAAVRFAEDFSGWGG